MTAPAISQSSCQDCGAIFGSSDFITDGVGRLVLQHQCNGQTVTRKFMVSPRSGTLCPIGAHPGNTGGKKGRSGRPSSAVRRAMREALDNRISVLEEIADDDSLSPTDRIKALDLLGKYGLGAIAAVQIVAQEEDITTTGDA